VVVGVVSIEEQGGRIRVERERTGGRREPIELEPPAVFCLQSGPHRPRYPSLSRLLRAKKTPPTRIDASSLVVPPGRALVVEAGLPEKRRTGKILEGTSREKAARLLRILNEKNLIHFKET
jgi:electron transfer flavoprotein beta subunit